MQNLVKIAIKILVLSFFCLLLTPEGVWAHEVYVLPANEVKKGLLTWSGASPFWLFRSGFEFISLLIMALAGAVFAGNFLLAASPMAGRIDGKIKKAKGFGSVIVRLALAASFLYGALGFNAFGPEISLAQFPFSQQIWLIKVVAGILIGVGFLTEAGAVLGLLIFLACVVAFGAYMLTYVNYFGELLVLALFGSRFLSLDRLFFGEKPWISYFEKFKRWETPILRICLGVALIYTAWSIKFSHSELPIWVIQEFHLEKFFFSWPSWYIAVGAGMVELMIGICILFGFAQRLIVLIFLGFISASLLFFREAVWPHFMLYGISIAIFIDNADFLTVDRYLVPFLRKRLEDFFKR